MISSQFWLMLSFEDAVCKHSDRAHLTICLSALSLSIIVKCSSDVVIVGCGLSITSAEWLEKSVAFHRGSGCACMLGVVRLGWRNVVGNMPWLSQN